jgi:hypothetical protein
MKVSMMLADHAQAVGGKLWISGGGWSITGPAPCPFAIAIDIKVPWHGINTDHGVKLELMDADGQPVEVETPEGARPIRLEGSFKVTPGPDARPGTPIDFPLAFNLPPQPIPPGGRYEWRLWIDGESQDDWRLSFSTRPAAAARAA